MICKHCQKETDDKKHLCQNCGEYVKKPPCLYLFVISAVMLIVAKIFSKTFLVLLLLPAIVLILVGVIMSITDLIRGEQIKKQ